MKYRVWHDSQKVYKTTPVLNAEIVDSTTFSLMLANLLMTTDRAESGEDSYRFFWQYQTASGDYADAQEIVTYEVVSDSEELA